jgi:recombination protein RecT
MTTDVQNGESRELTIAKRIGGALQRMQPEYRAVLPAHITPEAFTRVAQTAIGMNEDLQKCTPKSLIAACTKLAEVGLLPDGDEAAIVAYNVKVSRKGEPDRWEKQAKAMPMVRGIRNLVRNSGMVKDWKVRLVYSQDKFRHIDGDVELLEHEPAYVDGDRVVKVYSIAYLENGEISRHVMRIDAVDAIRRRSRSADKGPWVTDYEEMVKKTCLRQHSKALPKAKDDLNRQRFSGALKAVDDAEDVLQLENGAAHHAQLAAPVNMHQAAAKRLAEVAEAAVFDDIEDEPAGNDAVIDEPRSAPAASAPHAAAPKATRKRRSTAERIAANIAAVNGKEPPAPSPAPQTAKNGAPPIDDGRDLEFERQEFAREQAADMRGHDGTPDDDRFPGDPVPAEEFDGEDPEERAYRDGWHARSKGQTRLPPRDITTREEVAAYLDGWDAYDKAAKLHNAPKTAADSEAMLDEQVNKVFV